MLLENGPIDTLGYMILGYSVIFGVLALHIWSLRFRRINLEKDLELLEEIEKK
jgi:hypothetical protein